MKIYISGPITGKPNLNREAFAHAAALVTCDAIMLLHGWQGSKGARLENKIARKLKIQRVTAVWWVSNFKPGARFA